MNLERTIDGVTSPVTLAQLRREHNASIPAEPTAEMLAPYGVRIVGGSAPAQVTEGGPPPTRVEMHKFLNAARDFGLRVQLERHVLTSKGTARDYWFTAPFVARTSQHVASLAQTFALTESDLDTLFGFAGRQAD